MTLEVKNINSSIFASAILNDMAIALPIGASEEVYPTDYMGWVKSAINGHAYAEINGDRLICVKDSVQLSKARSIAFLRTFYGQPELALSETPPINGQTLIYNSTTGVWAPTNFSSASGHPYNLYYGALGNVRNSYLESAHGVSGDKTLGLCPFNMDLVGFSFSNANDSVVTNFKVRRAEYNAGVTRVDVVTFSIIDGRTSLDTTIVGPYEFNAGDKVAVYCSQVGKNPTNVEFVLLFHIRNDERFKLTENFSGDF